MKAAHLLSLLTWTAPASCTTSRVHRTAHPITLQYGAGHPYEAYSSRKLDIIDSVVDATNYTTESNVESINADTLSVFDSTQRYPVKKPSTSPTLSPSLAPTTSAPTFIGYDPELYEPLRIHVDTRRLQPVIEEDPTKTDFITYLETAAQKAAAFWSSHLSTIPVSSPIEITQQNCPKAFDGSETSHSFDDVDAVIYIFADEGPCLGEEPPIAFSDECAMDQFDRPIAGWLLLCSTNFAYISSSTPEGDSERQKLNEVLQHELAHILGMSGSTMAYWRDSLKGGAPRTPRPLVVDEMQCVNGTFINTTIPSEDTVRMGVTNSGIQYYEVVTPTVRNVVANQFNCDSATGARLDNFEHFDCIGSHWSTRHFAQETMVSRNMPWEQSITAVTLALFEDTGWYKANFSDILGDSFGYGAGCDFLTNDCIMDDAVPEFGFDTFCKTLTVESPIRCDASHRRFAKCDLVDYSTYAQDPIHPFMNVPPAPDVEFQYFTNTNIGSFMRYDGDYCPTYAAPPYATYNSGIPDGPLYAECALGRDMLADIYDFESYENDTSRCFNTIGNIDRPLCLNAECDASGDEVSIIVTVTDGEKVICEEEGQLIGLIGLNIQIECPKKQAICPEYFCPANCSGRGVCRHQKVKGCQCFDFNDSSSACENSPIQRPGEMPTPNPSPAPIQTDIPTAIPSSNPSEDITNFPSILAAIVGPTLSSGVSEEVQPEGETDLRSSSCIKQSGLVVLCISLKVAMLYLLLT